jgi:hypothetical protein
VFMGAALAPSGTILARNGPPMTSQADSSVSWSPSNALDAYVGHEAFTYAL